MKKLFLAWRPGLALCLGIVFVGSVCTASVSADGSRLWPTYQWGDRDSRGDSHGTIHALQLLLRAHGYSLAADGIYGRATEKAVRQFQQAQHLVPSGKMNNPTWEALVVPLKQGSAGPAVTAAQFCLEEAGFAVPPSGRFDAPMKTAVLKYQAQNGQTADGIIGAYTWSALVGNDDNGGP